MVTAPSQFTEHGTTSHGRERGSEEKKGMEEQAERRKEALKKKMIQ